MRGARLTGLLLPPACDSGLLIFCGLLASELLVELVFCGLCEFSGLLILYGRGGSYVLLVQISGLLVCLLCAKLSDLSTKLSESVLGLPVFLADAQLSELSTKRSESVLDQLDLVLDLSHVRDVGVEGVNLGSNLADGDSDP